jgi:hypothetical protein
MLTTPSEICDALAAANLTLTIAADGTAKLRGGKPAPELLAAIQSDKEAVIEEWERRESADRNRYGRAPESLPLRGSLLGEYERLSAAGQLRRHDLYQHAVDQGRTVADWLNARALAYFEQFDRLVSDKGLLAELAEYTACVDLVCWQSRCAYGNELFMRLAGFREAAKGIKV